MKHLVFGLFLCLFLSIGCSKQNSVGLSSSSSVDNISFNDNNVSVSDIHTFIAANGTSTKASGNIKYTLEPYCGADGEPLVYIVNYGDGDGWQLLSSDARTPAIIAEGNSGYFSLEDGSPAVRVWLDCMAADIAAVKCSTDEELSFSAEEIAAHRAVWGKEINKEPVPGDRLGHWVVDLVGTQEMIGDTLEHMTPHWSQSEPYNVYCPLKSTDPTLHAPAGCVAIAAANVLYYLHDTLGVPATMVSEGSCIGDVTGYSSVFWADNSNVWSQMDTTNHYYFEPAEEEALMIGYIGQVINMNYNNTYSWALPSNIRTQLFSLYYIQCSQDVYSENYVKSNLNDNMPVIVTATDLMIPLDFDIHCFVIDGYKKTFTRKTYYHHWEPREPIPINPRSDPMPYYTYVDTPQEITAIKINWGWSSQWHTPRVNDGWFTLTANWTVSNGGTYSYNYNVNMIYDICVSDE